MQEYTPVKEGKVREIYDIGDKLPLLVRLHEGYHPQPHDQL